MTQLATCNPATLLPAILLPATLRLCDPSPLPPVPPSYFFIRTFLDRPGKIGGLYHWFRGQGITLTLASPQAFMMDMVCHVMDDEFFPTYVISDLDGYAAYCPDTLE